MLVLDQYRNWHKVVVLVLALHEDHLVGLDPKEDTDQLATVLGWPSSPLEAKANRLCTPEICDSLSDHASRRLVLLEVESGFARRRSRFW
jgi:hypothetical protein